MLLTETHKLYKSQDKETYNLIYNLLLASKNLYNKANFYVRQAMIIGRKLKEDIVLSERENTLLIEMNRMIEKGNERKIRRAKEGNRKEPKIFNSIDKNSYFLDYYRLESMLQDSKEYKDLPAQSSQQNLKQLDSNWKAFFVANKQFKSNKNEFSGRPKLPKYKKGKVNILILTALQCKIKDNKICFPKIFKGFKLNTKADNICHVRIIKELNDSIKIEVVYEVEDKELKEGNNYLGIDLGLNNLAAIINNIGLNPILINGRGLKSINQYYNKKLAYYKSILDKSKAGVKVSKRIKELTIKRNNKIKDKMHKISRFIIDYAVKNNINKIVIGLNKGWKDEINLKKKVNQNFVGIPYDMLINQIKYKALLEGIEVIVTEEKYTSGTSFIDNEMPTKKFYNKKRRIYRGLFKSNSGVLINADINGACQILRKVYNLDSNEYKNMLRPEVINI